MHERRGGCFGVTKGQRGTSSFWARGIQSGDDDRNGSNIWIIIRRNFAFLEEEEDASNADKRTINAG